MASTIFEPVSQCSICGLDFPESELMRHYRTGRLVDSLCNDERTASDNLAQMKRRAESQKRAKQPVPSSEESSGQETVVLSLYPRLTSADYSVNLGVGGSGVAYVTGSINVGIVGLVTTSNPILGVVWILSFVHNAPRPIRGLTLTGITPNLQTIPSIGNLLALEPPSIELATTVTPLSGGQYYEWQYTFIY